MESEKQIPILAIGDEFNIIQGCYIRRVIIKEIDIWVSVSPSIEPNVTIIASKKI